MSSIPFQRSVADLQSYLKPFALSLTRNMDETPDLIQETLYKAFLNEDKFQEGTNLKAWLYTIMRNVFINDYRKKGNNRKMFEQGDHQLMSMLSYDTLAENDAESKLVMEDLNHLVSLLDDDFRIPFVRHFEGYKYNEIADELQIPLGTVKSRIFLARKELRKKLKRINIVSLAS